MMMVANVTAWRADIQIFQYRQDSQLFKQNGAATAHHYSLRVKDTVIIVVTSNVIDQMIL